MLKELKVMDEPKKPEKPVSEGDSIIARTIFGIAFLIVGSIMGIAFFAQGRAAMSCQMEMLMFVKKIMNIV